MDIISTTINELSPSLMRVSLELADADSLEKASESIVLTVELKIGGIPYLKEVQREALTRALGELHQQIEARKTAPRPAS